MRGPVWPPARLARRSRAWRAWPTSGATPHSFLSIRRGSPRSAPRRPEPCDAPVVIIRAIAVSGALAAVAVGLASPASADDRLDGDYTFINGPVTNTWNITTQCNAEVTCGGTISSSTGLVEQILRVAGGPWT